jgi:8-oxo-dGTP pyrophosphatase MutT (NUDIX family)
MSDTDTDPGIFRCRDAFLARAIERLGTYPSDFLSTFSQIKGSRKSIAPRQAAGVLLPLLFRQSSSDDRSEMRFVFQLIKRSSRVSQPGDLSCPGGMIHPFIDRILLPLLIHTPNPIIRGPARDYASQREPALRRIMTLFLANALRESWEEIGLSPFRVRLLGPLPTYGLKRFKRTIFPLAGFVEKPNPLNLNREVEKVVEIPLVSFYNEKAIGRYILSAPDPMDHGIVQSLQHPCLIHHDSSGGEEILWGATFHICIQFLEIVMDYRLPDWEKGRAVSRTLDSDYMTGKSTPKRFSFLDRERCT